MEMFECQECGKMLESTQGLAGHLYFKHGKKRVATKHAPRVRVAASLNEEAATLAEVDRRVGKAITEAMLKYIDKRLEVMLASKLDNFMAKHRS